MTSLALSLKTTFMNEIRALPISGKISSQLPQFNHVYGDLISTQDHSQKDYDLEMIKEKNEYSNILIRLSI